MEWNAAAGGDFTTPANWSPATVPEAGDTATFNIGLTGPVTLASGATPGSISFDTNATSFALGALGGSTITTANGGAISILSTLTAAAQTFTVNAPLVLTPDSPTTAGTFTIQNNGASASTTLVIAGGISSATTTATETLTLGGTNTGNNLVSGNISNGTANALALVKSGAGTWTLSGANTYTGGTSISGGTLALSGGNNRLPTTGTLAFTGTSGTLDVGSTSQSVSGLTFLIAGTNNNVITGAGGTLSVTGGSVHIGGGSNTSTGSNATTVSMAGLSTFNYTNGSGTFSVGGRADVGVAVSGAGTLTMAAVNTITAANFLVSPVSSGASSPNTGIVHLGQNNTINASTFTVGVGKATSLLDFQSLTNPTLKIRGTSGADTARAAVTVGVNDSGVVAGTATVDLTNGGTVSSTLDAMISTLMIGQNTRNLTAGFASTGTFIMGLGTLNATTIVIGQQNAVSAGNSSGAATGTLSLNGGTITATTLTLANKLASATAQAITSNFNLHSGTLNATTIQRGTAGTGAGASTATINFNWVDGTISNIAGSNQTVNGNTAVSGLTGGLNIVLNNTGNVSGTHTWNVSGTQTATVQDTVTLSGAGSLTKTGAGTLVLGGANSYAGTTTVSEGTLRFVLRSSLYNGNTTDWTATNLVVNAGAAAAFNVGGTGEFTSADIDLLKSLGTSTGGFKSGSSLGLDTTNASGGSFTYGSAIANPNNGLNTLGLVKLGTGTLVLTEASTYTGGTSIAGGTLALNGGDNRLPGTAALGFTGASGTLDVGSTSQTVSSLTFPTSGTSSHEITGAGGTLNVTGGNIQIGGGNTTSSSASQTVNMAGLGTFNYTNTTGSFNVGGLTDFNAASTTGSGILSLAATNTITAASFVISPYTTGQSSLNSGTVHLGQTNTINAATILIGNQKTTALLDFQNLVNPTLKIRGTGGADTDRAAITVGTNNSGITASNSTVDLTNGGTISSTLDAMVSTLMIGQNLRNATGLGLASTGTFTMGLGTLNATSITIGQQTALTGANTFSGAATGTLNLNGGTITVTTLTLADKLSGAAVQTITSNLNLYSGTLAFTTLQRGAAGTGAGASTATINFNWVDGTLSNIAGANQTVNGNTAVSGLTGGLNIVLNNTGNVSGTHTWNVSGTQTATLQSTAILSGPGSLTKAGTGTLVFTAVNTYSGDTVVNEGELQLNTTGGQAIAGNLTVNGGTARLLQSSQINPASTLQVGSGTFALQTFNQTMANVRLTGGSITGTTGVLTSTNAFDLQAGTVSSILGGSAGVVKTTSGTVTLSGLNTYTGGTMVSGGTLIATRSGALGTNSGLSIASGAEFAYRPTTAGSLSLGSGAITLTGGSTLGTAVGGTLGQSAITSSAAATASGAVTVDIHIIPGSSVTSGTHNLLTTGGGLTSGGATYSVGALYNATNFTLSGFQATDTTLSINVAAATALTNAYWKGGFALGNNVWAASNGASASNWVTNSNGTGATPLVPGSGATVTFSATGATNQGDMVLGASMSIRNLVVSDTSPVTLNADGNSLTIANAAGIQVNNGAGTVTLNAPIILGAAQTWTNNSGNTLTIGGTVTNAALALTVTGSGRTTISGAITGTGTITKNGTGTLTLSGPSTATGALTVNTGTVNVSGSYGGKLTVGSATTPGIINILPGANLAGSGTGLFAGNGAGSSGAIYQTGGNAILTDNFNLGLGGNATTTSYGFYGLSGGSIGDSGGPNVRFRVGGGASGAMGVFYQTGGSVNVVYGNGLEVGGNATGGFSNSTGIAYLTGGTFTAVSNRIGFNNTVDSLGGVRGEQTVAGSAMVTINGATLMARAAGDTGILNLNGGVYATRQIARGHADGISIVNFNGGTLRAASSATVATFLTGLTSANVYAGGLTVDTNNQNVTIGQALLAPVGDGVTTIPVTNGGSGYVGAPVISITGGGGAGATAVANMVDDGTGNGTFKIASITITSAGTAYTSAPTVSMIGGGGTGAVLDAPMMAASTSGGLTKTGNGSLTLNGTNTYTGATVVNAGGPLIAGNTSAFGVNSAATVDGTMRLAGRTIALGSLAGTTTGIVENANATAATLTVGGDNTTTTYNGVLQNGTGAGSLSLIKTGTGTQTLTGTSTYTGSTTISQGTLQVGIGSIGSLSASSAVSVNGATATLTGSGLVGGAVTVTSGFIQPGDNGGAATGTLKVGSLNVTAGGTGVLQIDGAASNDKIVVLNSSGLTLDGRLSVTTSLTGPAFDAAFAVGTTFDLLDWEGVLDGAFDVGATIRNGSADNGLQFDLPDLSSLSRFWDVSSFLTHGTIVVGVPEPGRAMLLMLAFGTLAFRRRRMA
ncbi:MAG: autotransporter-associated beta strand repeat-containing protein [Prosthecobacter sp.]